MGSQIKDNWKNLKLLNTAEEASRKWPMVF